MTGPPHALAVAPVDRLTVLATEIKSKLTLARRHGQATLSALMDVGDRLAEAKKALDHGQWDDWLSDNFELSDRTARLYMQLAGHRNRVEAKMATVATLGIREALEQIHEDQIHEGNVKRNREAMGLEPRIEGVRRSHSRSDLRPEPLCAMRQSQQLPGLPGNCGGPEGKAGAFLGGPQCRAGAKGSVRHLCAYRSRASRDDLSRIA